MKTPEEIKKGLECCKPIWKGNHWKTCGDKCPYYNEAHFCRTMLNSDAIALIQQLEAQNAELKRERDAAVADLATIHKCEPCKHRTSNSYTSNECFDCVNFCNFEWRGPCEENTENP